MTARVSAALALARKAARREPFSARELAWCAEAKVARERGDLTRGEADACELIRGWTWAVTARFKLLNTTAL